MNSGVSASLFNLGALTQDFVNGKNSYDHRRNTEIVTE